MLRIAKMRHLYGFVSSVHLLYSAADHLLRIRTMIRFFVRSAPIYSVVGLCCPLAAVVSSSHRLPSLSALFWYVSITTGLKVNAYKLNRGIRDIENSLFETAP